MDLTYIPWGNAYHNSSQCGHPGGYDRGARKCWRSKCGPDNPNPPDDCLTALQICQHGPDECVANRRESCAISLYPNVTQWFPFIKCYEKGRDLSTANAKACAQKTFLDFNKIEACNTGKRGQQLDVQNAKLTLAYPDEWEGTPTVTVAGNTTDVSDLLSSVCKAYSGPKPPACDKFNLNR